MVDTQEIDTVRSARSVAMARALAAALEFPWVTHPSREVSSLLCERGHYFDTADRDIQQDNLHQSDLSKSSFDQVRNILITEPGKYTYFEGFVANKEGINAHAWLVDNQSNTVFDPSSTAEGSYFGVPLKDGYVTMSGPDPLIVGKNLDVQAVKDHVRSKMSEEFSALVLESVHLLQHQIGSVAWNKASEFLAGKDEMPGLSR